MVTHKRTVLVLGLLTALALPACSFPFKVGETLDYEFHYLEFMRGTARQVVAEQTTYQGVRAFHMTEDISAGVLFTNHIEVYCRQSDLMPLLITTRMKNKGKESQGRQVYHPEKRNATFSLSEGGKTKSQTFQCRRPVQDIVTVMYYLRAKNLIQGASFPISLREGEYLLTVSGKESLKSGVRGMPDPLECWVIESYPPRIKAWLTADERHLPVRVETFGKGSTSLFLKAVN